MYLIPVLVAIIALGTGRTLIGIPRSLIAKKPIRLDIPIPGFPVDVVLVSDPDQIQVKATRTSCLNFPSSGDTAHLLKAMHP